MKISRFFLLMLLLGAVFFYFDDGEIITAARQKAAFLLPSQKIAEVKDADLGINLADSNSADSDFGDLDINDSFYSRHLEPLLFPSDAVDAHFKGKSYVPLNEISPIFRQAIVATEDSRFYDHFGIDFTGIVRAALVNLQYGQIEEGASTITQQLAKNLFLSQERSFARKGEEFLLALRLESFYDKDKLLEIYLNAIYFGSGYYGIGDAAEGYFGKTPSELSPAEAAMLAGLPNAPSLYSPYEDFAAAKARQKIVISRLQKEGFITSEDAEKIFAEPVWLAH